MNSTSSSAGSAGGTTIRLTVAQAVVKFLGQQYSERDGVKRKFFAGCFGIFGHGNVAGLGQALLQSELLTPGELPYHQGRNEQAMVHIAAGYAASVGPAAGVRGDRVGRSGGQQHAHRCRVGDHQPAARAVAAE